MAKILIVEDDPFLSTMYKTRFEKDGHIALVAQDGESAVEQLKQNPDILLLDIMLPKISGVKLLSALNDEQRKNLHIIVMTNLADPEVEKQAKALGAVEFLSKDKNTPSQIAGIVNKYVYPS